MKQTTILKASAARSMVFASLMICSMVNMSHGQTGSTEGQHSSGWGDTPPSQRDSPPRNSSPANQTSSPSSGPAPAAQGSGSCKYSTPEQESFLCALIRIFYGADTPRGPNRDVDENIGIGGAAG
ncbi:MAG: hypothetical protein ABI167_05330 [Nitrosospira sp.]